MRNILNSRPKGAASNDPTTWGHLWLPIFFQVLGGALLIWRITTFKSYFAYLGGTAAGGAERAFNIVLIVGALGVMGAVLIMHLSAREDPNGRFSATAGRWALTFFIVAVVVSHELARLITISQ